MAEKETEEEVEEIVEELVEEEVVEGEESEEDGEKEIPLFMVEDEETEPPSGTVPLGAHVKAKDKLKGKIGERDEEIERLRKENEDLKKSVKPEIKAVKRPRVSDFDSDEEYEKAMDEWEQNSARNTYETYEQSKKQQEQAARQVAAIKESVDSHYDRAEKLVKEHSISPEVYRKADAEVRAAVATAHENADIVTDAFISALGEGSEKALFYVGRNKTALNEFKALLNTDKTGLRVAAFLGEVKARVQGTTKQKSRAPAPSAQLNGESASPKGAADKRKYDKAHKSGNTQEAYNIKKNARKAGFDTSKW